MPTYSAALRVVRAAAQVGLACHHGFDDDDGGGDDDGGSGDKYDNDGSNEVCVLPDLQFPQVPHSGM
jgi:hypothetical protein